MALRPSLQFSIPVKEFPEDGFPDSIAPVWSSLSAEEAFPTTVELVIVNKWIGGVGEWYFRTFLEPEEGEIDTDSPENKSDYDFPGEGAPFVDVVRQSVRVSKPGLWWCVLECGGREVLRYPVPMLAPEYQAYGLERKRE